jgi:hypothetical protein
MKRILLLLCLNTGSIEQIIWVYRTVVIGVILPLPKEVFFGNERVILYAAVVATLGSNEVFHSSVAIYPELVEAVYPEPVEGHSYTLCILFCPFLLYNISNGIIC